MKETIVTNKQSYFNYHIISKKEAGLVLTGHEVRSIKEGRISLNGSFISVRNKELFLINAQISSFQPNNTPVNFQPNRPKKLLLKKEEIKKIINQLKEKGITLIPIRIYLRNNKIKLEFALAKGKKKWQKKEIIKKREIQRRLQRVRIY